MKLPKRDIIPACYDFALEETTLLIHVHEKAAEVLKQTLTRSSPIVPVLQQELNLPEFILPAEEQWGFGNVLSRRQSTLPSWIVYECPLPVVLGPKIGDEGNWSKVFAVSATLRLLFWALELEVIEGERDSAFAQFLFVDNIAARRGMHGGSLNVTVCPPLCEWLHQQKDNSEHSEIAGAMKRVFWHMSGRPDPDPLGYARFRAWMRQPKWVNLSCPGEACGLDPDDYYELSLNRGYGLAPHNVDTPIQQLTLLAGLAVMCQLARAS